MKPILVLLNPKNLLAHCLIIQHNLDTICICSPLREVSVLTPHAISAHLELYKTHQSVVGPSVLVLSLTITKILIFYLFLPGCDFFFNPAAENIRCSMFSHGSEIFQVIMTFSDLFSDRSNVVYTPVH